MFGEWGDELVALLVVFVLSLAGAFVTFKFLKSWAKIKKAEWQAGGAFAGLVILLWVLSWLVLTMHNSRSDRKVEEAVNKCQKAWADSVEKAKPIRWTIDGRIEKQNATNHQDIQITHMPLTQTTTGQDGYFSLENVIVEKISPLPQITAKADGYGIITIPQKPEDCTIIDTINKKITLKRRILKNQ
jgi:hypothetical protein